MEKTIPPFKLLIRAGTFRSPSPQHHPKGQEGSRLIPFHDEEGEPRGLHVRLAVFIHTL